VRALRQDIDQQPDRFKGALQDPDFRREFLGGAAGGKKAADAFIAQNKESALKTRPKVSGFAFAVRYFIPRAHCPRGNNGLL
jgi:hypothetical protein